MAEQIIWYLEMRDPKAHHARAMPETLGVVECEIPQFELNRFLYRLVGTQWQWSEMLEGDQNEWRAMVESDAHRTFVAYYRGAVAGYYELYRPDGVNVEILYFGLVETFIGMGFGAGLLSHAIDQAWRWPGTDRVWLHTCSLDHPAALENYQKRGFEIYHEEVAPC
ncbi:GNAT family N-acetyltransferase [Kushneria marisflavi]|uniref:GNAT family N-acetyltransferase n=1 Tax=Kushneria marisflavi TaxID=157779 RepID=A0A240UNY1_9GAMM|nr:GNAT family N-acetyltransferase [Kushneria marisflavi]ART62730.1 GNAT family N-acetyltransferase [Kushneria marisflavi]RKD83863.1 acetyltransferase (GNAT) family protein [Kushneria marisflavi]